jgi:septum formation protein
VVFHTAVALVNGATGLCRSALVDVASTFRSLDDAALEAYLDRELPLDCAGSVKSEGLGVALFTRIASDDPTALIGLPLIRLVDLLEAEGVRPLALQP